MFKLGTGDCFVIKFFSGQSTSFKLMIDAGCWSGDSDKISPYIMALKEYVQNQIDLLVITHEHKDHVHAFDVCQKLFTKDFTINEIWMGWSENDDDPRVSDWKREFGEKKKALFKITKKLKSINEDPETRSQLSFEKGGDELFSIKENFLASLSAFSNLHFDDDPVGYKGLLKGMEVVKKLGKSGGVINFRTPGEIIEKKVNLPGVRFYILGPPSVWEEVKKEKGKKGESYEHNNDLPINEGFSAAALALDSLDKSNLCPFNPKYAADNKVESYKNQDNYWRNIDNDWLNSSGMLALRINSKTNNLSLAIAIEFEESGKVLLFPGDAEFGSWESWHKINWGVKSRTCKGYLTTEELLNRTVLYKVAHHLSHNGTAKKIGLDMMTNSELVAMATLDYHNISSHWKSTMPNMAIIDDLLGKTKGRLLVLNERDVPYDRKKNIQLTDEIIRHRLTMSEDERNSFIENLNSDNPLFIQFRIEV
ncbi:MBL fold metallo-hydrolase [Algoriphagus aestuariicola]|nr:MBL fold metallo-hydrolase [Algoriphagus aestuariicola]